MTTPLLGDEHRILTCGVIDYFGKHDINSWIGSATASIDTAGIELVEKTWPSFQRRLLLLGARLSAFQSIPLEVGLGCMEEIDGRIREAHEIQTQIDSFGWGMGSGCLDPLIDAFLNLKIEVERVKLQMRIRGETRRNEQLAWIGVAAVTITVLIIVIESAVLFL